MSLAELLADRQRGRADANRLAPQSTQSNRVQIHSPDEMKVLLNDGELGELLNVRALDRPDKKSEDRRFHIEVAFQSGSYCVPVLTEGDFEVLKQYIGKYIIRIKQKNDIITSRLATSLKTRDKTRVEEDRSLPRVAPELWPGKQNTPETVDAFFRRHYGKHLKNGLSWKLLEKLDPKLRNAVKNYKKVYLKEWPADLAIETTRSRLDAAMKEVEKAQDLRVVSIEKLAAVTRKLAREGRQLPKSTPERPSASRRPAEVARMQR